MQKDKKSFKVVWGVVYDLNLSCLECVSKVDQDSMINLCNSMGVKEDLSTVPVKLGDISKVENPDPMTETFYLEKIQVSLTSELKISFINLICQEELSCRNIS